MLNRRSLLGGALAAFGLPASIASAQQREAEHAHALLISASYLGVAGITPLPNTRNDALLLETRLRGLNFRRVNRVENATEASLNSQLSSFLDGLRTGDLAFVYIAAHGVQINGENFVLLEDGQTFISLVSIVQLLRAATDTVVLLLDACRENPYSELPANARVARALRLSRSASVPAGPSSGETDQASDVNFVFKPLAHTEATRRVGAFTLQGPGVRIVFATDPDNVALEAASFVDRNSPFAVAIARRIVEMRSLDDVISLATGDVVRATDGFQSPWSQGSIDRPIYLAGPPKSRNPAKPPFQVPG